MTDPVPEPLPPDDVAVAALIGRTPFTRFRVAVRCPHGGPAVLENDPLDLRDRPFPTRYWLACRTLVEAVSRLESTGGVRRLDGDPDLADALAEANGRHRDMHAGHNIAGAGDPRRAKCLHAHLAFGLATGGGPVADWIQEQSGAEWPSTCCLRRGGPPVEAHGGG